MNENRTSHQTAIAWSNFKTYALTRIRRPAGVSCGFCFFAVLLSVLSLSRLSLWRGFLPTSWRSSSSSSFRLDFSCLTFCWVQLCPRLSQHRFGFEHVAVISMDVSAFFVVFAIDLLRGFLYPILDPLAFVPDTFTRIHFLYMASSRTLVYPHVLVHFVVWTKASIPCFAQHVFLPKKNVLYTNIMFSAKQCSCWACSNPVCCLQNSFLHGGRRNTPKAVQLDLD